MSKKWFQKLSWQPSSERLSRVHQRYHNEDPQSENGHENNPAVIQQAGADVQRDEELADHSAHFDGPAATVAYQDENIRFLVRRVDFMRQKNHLLYDHMYSLICDRLKSSAPWPLAVSVLQALYSALKFILRELVDFYSKKLGQSLDRYVICTFISDHLENGINTSAFKLSDDPNDIVDEFR